MNKEKYIKIINSISSEIENNSTDWELFYQRGYYFYLLDNEELAKENYKQALTLGMDATNYPYYKFSNSNELRRDFILPEKILVFLVLIIIAFALTTQVANFILKIKGVL